MLRVMLSSPEPVSREDWEKPVAESAASTLMVMLSSPAAVLMEELSVATASP